MTQESQAIEQLKIGEVETYFPESIDSTMLSAFSSCPQKWFNEFSLRIAPRGVAPHLHAGGAFALAIETVRREVYQNGKTVEDALLAAWVPFMRYWGDYEPPEGSGAEMKDSISMWGALVAYFNHWHPATDALAPMMYADGKPALEFRFAIPTEVNHPITGDPILYSGRCDMIGQYNDMIAPVDEKTSKAMGASWARQWLLRGQFMGYVYAVRLYGYECRHAVARGIGLLKTEYKFQEAFVTYPDWLLEHWWESLHEKLSRMVTQYTRMLDNGHVPEKWHNYFPQDFADACQSYGGCSYLELCRSVDKPTWYPDFARRAWNPLSIDPSEGSVDHPPKEEAQLDEDMLRALGIKL